VREGDRWAKWVSAVALAGGGLVAVPVLIALYALFRARQPEFAFLGVLLGVVGVLGTATHGAFDVAGLSKRVEPDPSSVPNFVDPRGFATFGLTALALLVFGVIGVANRRARSHRGAAGSGSSTVSRPMLLVNPAFFLLFARSLLLSTPAGARAPA
jgi:hypothetical protein